MLNVFKEFIKYKQNFTLDTSVSVEDLILQCYLFLNPQEYSSILLERFAKEESLTKAGSLKYYRDSLGQLVYLSFNLNTTNFRLTNVKPFVAAKYLIHYQIKLESENVYIDTYKIPYLILSDLVACGVLDKTPSHGKSFELGADYTIALTSKDMSYLEAYKC